MNAELQNNIYIVKMELLNSNNRFKELQKQLNERDQKQMEFYNTKLEEKNYTINRLETNSLKQETALKNQFEQKNTKILMLKNQEQSVLLKQFEDKTKEKETIYEEERNLLIKEIQDLKLRLKKFDSLEEDLVEKMNEINSQKEQNQKLCFKIRNEQNSVKILKKELDHLKSTKEILDSEFKEKKIENNRLLSVQKNLYDKLENKVSQINTLITTKQQNNGIENEVRNLKLENQKYNMEFLKINDNLDAQKEKIKSLLINLDEIANEKSFYETKVNRLENRLLQYQNKNDIQQSHHLRSELEKLKFQNTQIISSFKDPSDIRIYNKTMRIPSNSSKRNRNFVREPNFKPANASQRGTSSPNYKYKILPDNLKGKEIFLRKNLL